MAALEKRHPRESFTKKLIRICQRLDEHSIRAIMHKSIYREHTCEIEITSIWVVGSYARGALTCGDLDLVIGLQNKGVTPSTRVWAKAFFGSPSLVRYYPGNPNENASGVAFPEAILIWSGPGCDWKAAIDAIKPDLHAGRAARETDAIPLRDEQLRTYYDEYHDAVDMQRDGLWEWEFVEIGKQMLAPTSIEAVAEDEAYFKRCAPMMGRKSQELVPAMIKLMREQEPSGSWSSADSSRSKFRCGSSEVHLGRPALPIDFFDYSPWVRQLILIPHISARGPNGAWIIRRGPEHPDRKALVGKYAYYLMSSGHPDTITYCDHSKHWAPTAIELLETHKEAQHLAAQFADEDDSEEPEIGKAEGLELLSLFGLVDIVEVGGEQLAMTYAGSSYLETDIISLEELVTALPST
ncbi:hypothetical protein C4K35_4237 [Pseudomonas chlororaphis subsp. piscium]|uniref:hypothetical protein n=1 Tax=Pseudomonas chlororaphis TaxID=587753 RepID=UPI000F577421|nr:hypothetical protein [Pseudomonas chlororaphis]AZC51812.1 hypothetical protein C4K35_4237 [Pseudomonas chlororaphis subsp. piscium]AZD85113.1 hypothetical protein C4K14_2289 [Pseudomonas chlororaphis subsp. aureofaciens]